MNDGFAKSNELPFSVIPARPRRINSSRNPVPSTSYGKPGPRFSTGWRLLTKPSWVAGWCFSREYV